ncbi:MAG: Gar1/Naf1 family protein [Candidatus Bathyarchaeia archaeon]
MIRLGRVLHISSSKNIIVKIENAPKIGDIVVDEDLKPIGKVFDVFGPVSSPYAAVKPKVAKPEIFINKTLYLFPSEKRRR